MRDDDGETGLGRRPGRGRRGAPEDGGELRGRKLDGEPVRLGASPRASIDLVSAARAHALLDGRDHAEHGDMRRAAKDVLRHRISLAYDAEADGIRPDEVIEAVLALAAAP